MKSFKQFLCEDKGIGKDIGGSIYVHKNYINGHPKVPNNEYQKAIGHMRNNYPTHEYDIVKYTHHGNDKGSFSFIHSPDFNTSHEPISGNSVKVKPDGTTSFTKQKTDPQIYHHKHLFVGNDYKGFDINKSKSRSEHWGSISGINRSKIGTKSYWEREVTPQLNGHEHEYGY